MAWFKKATKAAVCTDLSQITELVTQLNSAVQVVDDYKAKAASAAKVVENILSQLQSATEQKDRAVEALKEAQGSAQTIINSIGAIKLEMGLGL